MDDSLAKYFPDGSQHWQRVTLRHLLSHWGDVPNYTEARGLNHQSFIHGGSP